MYKIILDIMGGDNAPGAVLDGASMALKEIDDISLVLVGKKELIPAGLLNNPRVEVINAREEIEMAEPPVFAIRTKRNSSMVVGMNMLKNGEGDAFITAGSTGAAIAGATLIVRRAKGVERAALAPVLPNNGAGVLLIDCGANVDCKPAHLRQFAIMGSVYAKTVMGISNPRVGLINNGAEEEKGNALTKEAFKLMQETDINFVGNAEGRDILSGNFDVVVCDGFVGNVLMKFLEGAAVALMGMLKVHLSSSFRSKLGAGLAMPAFRAFKRDLDYSEYGGALMLGVKAGVIKAHGSSNAKAIKSTILQAREFSKEKVVEQISEKLSEFESAD
jgi:glycerol-3-phosphate acyltransferase PlsX